MYPFVFMDCIHYKVREDGRILSRTAYVVLGVTVERYENILSITVGANKTSKFWLGMLNDLKNRGVKEKGRNGCKPKAIPAHLFRRHLYYCKKIPTLFQRSGVGRAHKKGNNYNAFLLFKKQKICIALIIREF